MSRKSHRVFEFGQGPSEVRTPPVQPMSRWATGAAFAFIIAFILVSAFCIAPR